jgi:hypothetical protein
MQVLNQKIYQINIIMVKIKNPLNNTKMYRNNTNQIKIDTTFMKDELIIQKFLIQEIDI